MPQKLIPIIFGVHFTLALVFCLYGFYPHRSIPRIFAKDCGDVITVLISQVEESLSEGYVVQARVRRQMRWPTYMMFRFWKDPTRALSLELPWNTYGGQCLSLGPLPEGLRPPAVSAEGMFLTLYAISRCLEENQKPRPEMNSGAGAEHMQWLVPGISASQALATLNAWTPFDQFQMHQSAICLETVAHLRAEHPYAAGGLHLICKAEILRGIRKNLEDPVKALSPSTLGVLVALASFEVAQDSPEAQSHLLGIGSILKARGGLEYQGFGEHPLSRMGRSSLGC